VIWERGKVAVADQINEEQADSHLDIALDFGLASGGRHEVSAGQAFVEGNTADVNLLTF
jgi:hypothetical protein